MEQENVQNVETSEVVETEKTESTVEETNAVKTFTQEQVNELVAKEKARVKKGLPSKEEMEAFNTWKESQKTAEQRQQEILDENNNLKKQIEELKNTNVVANANVDTKFQKFVINEVSQMGGDFESNLEEYLQENPQYLIQKEVAKLPQTDGIAVSKQNISVDDGVTAYLKSRHPNLF